jgi:LysM domain
MMLRTVLMALALAPLAAHAQQAAAPMQPGTSVPDPTESALNAGLLVGVPAPTSSGPKQATGGGFLPSSSQGRAPGETDSFDLRRGGSGAGTVRGGKDGPVFLNRLERPAGATEAAPGRASVVTVQKGDSLWSICERELGNAYAWPKVWALNPTIENPHVLEPGQQIRLRAQGEGGEGAEGASAGAAGSGRAGLRLGAASTAAKGEPYKFQGRERRVTADSVFQLDEGLVEDGDSSVVGEIEGAPSDRLYLAAGDEVWVRSLDPKKKKLENGQLLSVYRMVEETNVGAIVHVVGTVKVTGTRDGYAVARGVIVEATDVVERGMRLSSDPRELRAIAPRAGGPDLEARILGSTHLHVFYGQNQVVFIDRGSNDKLEPGHTLFVERQGDGLANSTSYRMARTSVSLDSERANDEREHSGSAEENLPNDLVAELRVVAVKAHSATCLVVRSRREIEKTDVARTHAAP